MKLAQAVARRKDLTVKLADLERRAIRVAVIQEGQTAPEMTSTLLDEIGILSVELVGLVKQINRANVTPFPEGGCLAEMIVDRNFFRTRGAYLRQLADSGTPGYDRYSRSELVSVSTVDVGELVRQSDALFGQARQLDLEIQRLDWQIEI